ncbi:50S ribosomal protein L28, apicoplast, putative [Plasmodium gallinaceum]|uniref:Large ribosomal subunit protein bL28c n=1 Tax=Plasmodium gallinaceum TaxID=5849 RepID=A0A1J1H391_PLAGA|nr:50S ribosomal protein L28, apicoplast, putative [Plasmodium gallinaceum]CRG97807.1 50S ribosomal protein L28, apicoplast, putative [Plasmodium gallinaceum]
MQSKTTNKIFNLTKNVYILYIIININSLLLYGHSTINKYETKRINFQNYFYVKLLIKKQQICKNNYSYKKPHVSKFSLYTKKRHKEALEIKKYRMKGTSSIARHYGLKGKKRINKVTMMPHKEIKLPIRRCMILGKMDNWNARKISKSGVKTHRIQRLNLIKKRIFFEEENRFVKLKVSAKGLKTIKKYGLSYCCKKFNLDLSKKKFDAGYSLRRKKKKDIINENHKLNEKTNEIHEDANNIMNNLNLNK